jgi:hypothetical protein
MPRPLFEKRHYEAVASALGELDHQCLEGRCSIMGAVAVKFSHLFKEDNENFNVAKFLEAIDKTDGTDYTG